MTEGSEKKKNNSEKTPIGVVGLLVGDDGAILTLALHFPDLFETELGSSLKSYENPHVLMRKGGQR